MLQSGSSFYRAALRGGAASLALIIGATALPAAAQTTVPAESAGEVAESAEDTIVVTGTRIARPDLEVASPVNVVGAEEISLRQPNTAEELLRDLPSVRPALGPGVNNGGDGSAQIDLRGLNQAGTNTSQRTLVLLDGRRIVPYGLDGFTDLNNIPVALIDRVDVVTGGAASVYGADAVAGVVNFITKRDFTGLSLGGNYRISEKGDARQYRADLTVGASFDDDRGNAVLSIGYSNRAPLLTTSRSIGAFPVSASTGGFQGATAAVPTIIQGTPSNAALGLPASDFGAAYDPALGAFRSATAADTYNSNENQLYQTPLERYSIYAGARYEVAENVEVYTVGMFNRNESRLQLASTGTFSNPYQIPLNNAYLPRAAREQLCFRDSNTQLAGVQPALTQAQCDAAAVAQGPGSPGYVEVAALPGRRFVEFGPRLQEYLVNQFQSQVGVRGDLTDSLTYDLFAQHGETTQNQTRGNWGSFSRLQQALRSFRNAQGVPVCSDASNNCVPINIFGPRGTITPDQLAFVDLDAQIRRQVKLTVFGGNLAGDLFGVTSPFAENPVAFSLGTEYRRLSARSSPDAPSQIQGEVLGTGARTPPDFGRITARELFGELIVPIVEDRPFFHNLQAEGGIRYSDYNTTGTSTTWKAGGTYEPIEGYKFRGMYQVAVRSPNINELFQSPVTALNNLTVDPCQATQLASPGANAQLAALCVATGAPANAIGSIPSPTSGQINVTTAGNPNLDVESAKTYTLGAVVTPPFAPGLAVTVDYFNIRITDAISNPAAGDILNGCYSTALNPSQTPNAFCDLIRRNPLNGSLNGAGETPGVILAGTNLGKIETAGVDLGVSYRFELADLGMSENAGSLRFAFNGTWLDYYHFQATPNSINRNCTGYYSTNCTNPRPEYKWNSRLTYSNGPFDLSLNWTHISSVRVEPVAPSPRPANAVPQTGGPAPATIFDAFERIDAYDYFDLAGRMEIGNVDFTLTIENLFNKKPPLVSNFIGGTSFNSGNTFPTTYDVIGRTFTIGANVKF